MTYTTEKQETLLAVYPALRKWVDGFLVAKRAKGTTPGTVAVYCFTRMYFSKGHKRLAGEWTSYQMTRIDSKRFALPKDWTLVLGGGTLILASGLAIVKLFGEGPAHLQSGQHTRSLYWAVLAYAYVALPATGVILLAWASLFVVWLARLTRKTPSRNALVAAGVSSLALLWASASTLPQLFVGYRHLATVTEDSRQYHLGVRTALDGDDFYVVSACRRGNPMCEAYASVSVDYTEKACLRSVRLETGTTAAALYIRTDTRLIPVTINPPW
jgi:hypothetical protein